MNQLEVSPNGPELLGRPNTVEKDRKVAHRMDHDPEPTVKVKSDPPKVVNLPDAP